TIGQCGNGGADFWHVRTGRGVVRLTNAVVHRRLQRALRHEPEEQRHRSSRGDGVQRRRLVAHLARPACGRLDERATVPRSAFGARRRWTAALRGRAVAVAANQPPAAVNRTRHGRRVYQHTVRAHTQLPGQDVDSSRAVRRRDDCHGRCEGAGPMRSRLRSLMLATAVVAIAAGATTAVLVLVDMYLHTRYERSAGFNLWGYRGPSVGSKKPAEYRVAVLGGSAAYGYGVNAEEAIPAVLERPLRRRALSATFTVVNLGYNNEGAYSFKTTLNDYAWLRYDLALLYEGYNDLSQMRPNLQVFRHESPVFRLTGYLPIFPIIFREKA